MIEEQTAGFRSLIDAIVTAGLAPDAETLTKVAQTLAKIFGVDPDEVAILRLDLKSKNLKFVIPEKLAAVGSIPLSSATALAARSARERRTEVANNFGAARHASVFEGVPLGRQQGELIQKLMSAPVVVGTHVLGVVQISRKGRSSPEAGPDFTQKDLGTLASLSPALGRFLKLSAKPDRERRGRCCIAPSDEIRYLIIERRPPAPGWRDRNTISVFGKLIDTVSCSCYFFARVTSFR